MVDHGDGPRPGSRDNGLRAARYVAVGDLDPRVADALLVTLRDEGIAAYVSPTPGSRGGYLEVRLPSQPSDRLYVDEARVEQAAGLLAAEEPPPAQPEPDGLDTEAAWQQVLASLQASGPGSQPMTRPWPASEDVDSYEPVSAPAPEPEDHFEPPPPPPLPKLRPITVLSLVAIIVGILILVTGVDDGNLSWLGILAIIGGAVSLVWHVKDGPPGDSGWDDGAVV